VTDVRIQAWLRQFARGDQDMAARVLDSVQFITFEEIDTGFKKMLGALPGWHTDPRRRSGVWRFVAFSRGAGESGDTMLHRFRVATRLTAAKFSDLFIHKSELVRERLGPDDSVVFVDDFAGTGHQATTAWHETLSELLPDEPTVFLMLVAASTQARRRISENTRLRLVAETYLLADDDIFGSPHFTPAERSALIRYCRRANAQHPRGYGNCGFVLVLAHRTPNNSIPILHADHGGWRGLFPR
jgi:hypothetical protein